MTEKLYIDTNVIIDVIDGRKNEFGEALSDPASKVFTDAISCKYHLIFQIGCFRNCINTGSRKAQRCFLSLQKRK